MHSHLFLLLLVISTATGMYVFVREYLYWDEALTHCRTHYTDLAPIVSEHDTSLLKQVSGNYIGYIWFGLMRNASNLNKWMWSGGGEVTTFYWDVGQPQGWAKEMYGILLNYRWHDAPSYLASFFFCYSVRVVSEEKTWEEALEHCRKQHTDLASISSETEMMLIQNELIKDVSTEHVWMGLRFLAGDWFWVDGHKGEYEAWGSGGKVQCPEENLACGALGVNSGNVKQWKGHDCQEKLHFICS